jgi:hypothetical protein
MLAVRCLKPRLSNLTLAHFEYARTLIVVRVLGQTRSHSQTYFRLSLRWRLLQKTQTHLGLGWTHQSRQKTRCQYMAPKVVFQHSHQPQLWTTMRFWKQSPQPQRLHRLSQQLQHPPHRRPRDHRLPEHQLQERDHPRPAPPPD